MAFADPQSITVNAVAQSLPRIQSANGVGTFQKDDGSYALTISHTVGKRSRRQVRVDFSKIAADPYATAVNNKYTGSVYLVIDHPPAGGWTNAEIKDIVLGLTGWLTSANVLKVLGSEV